MLDVCGKEQKMQLDKLRMIVGFSVISSHLASFGMILLGPSLTSPERIETALLIGPIFSVYVTAIVRRFVLLVDFDRTPVHPALTILAIGSAMTFSIAVPSVLVAFQEGRIENFPTLKSTLGIIETALGLYTGAIVDRLFGTNTQSRKNGLAKKPLSN